MNSSYTNGLRQALIAKPMKICGMMLIALPMVCACIYDTPEDDSFHRTLWTTNEFPYGSITLEFLCGNNVNIKGNNGIGSYGFYRPAQYTAYFSSLSLRYETDRNITITIEEAHRSDEILFLTWHIADSDDSHITAMTRLKAYQ